MKFKLLVCLLFAISLNALAQTNKYVVVSSYGKNMYNNKFVQIGSIIDLETRGRHVLHIDKHLVIVNSNTKLSYEFNGAGIYNLDSAISTKRNTTMYEKIIGYIFTNVQRPVFKKNIRSASVEMSINPDVVTFPKITRLSDPYLNVFFKLNNNFFVPLNEKDSIVYTLLLFNSKLDTVYMRKTNRERFSIQRHNMQTKSDSIVHWQIEAMIKTQKGTQIFKSKLNTIILDSIQTFISSVKPTDDTYVYELIKEIDNNLRDANYAKMIRRINDLDSYLKISNDVSYSSETGKKIIEYTLREILNYSEEEISIIMLNLYNKK